MTLENSYGNKDMGDDEEPSWDQIMDIDKLSDNNTFFCCDIS